MQDVEPEVLRKAFLPPQGHLLAWQQRAEAAEAAVRAAYPPEMADSIIRHGRAIAGRAGPYSNHILSAYLRQKEAEARLGTRPPLERDGVNYDCFECHGDTWVHVIADRAVRPCKNCRPFQFELWSEGCLKHFRRPKTGEGWHCDRCRVTYGRHYEHRTASTDLDERRF